MITKNNIQEAYEKLKYFSFYDKTFVHLKEQIIEFESKDAKKKLSILADNFNIKKEDYFQNLINKIQIHVTPKGIECEDDKYDFVSVLSGNERIKIKSLNYYIKAPIEIHILNILWIGYSLIKLPNINEKHIFANKLDINYAGNLKNGKKTFIPYFENYQSWLNNALTTSESLAKENKNFIIISLDIKRFYYSIRQTIKELSGELESNYEFKNYLTRINVSVNKKWDLLLGINQDESVFSLPIGLLSSGILANYYCKHIDEKIQSTAGIRYYGRYVDDIIIIKEISKKTKYTNSNKIISDHLVDPKILSKIPNNDNYVFTDNHNLEIQPEKLKLFLFSGKSSLKQIELIKNELLKNSSEVNLIPDMEMVYKNLDKIPFEIKANDKRFKLRDIQSIENNKFEVSKLLSQAIYIQKYCDVNLEEKQKLFRNLDKIFKGKYILEYRNLWSKYLVCLVIFERQTELLNFINRTQKLISRIVFDSEIEKPQVIESLKNEFIISLNLALSGNFEFHKKIKRRILRRKSFISSDSIYNIITEKTSDELLTNYRRSYFLDPVYYRMEGIFLFEEYFDQSINLYSYNLSERRNLTFRKGDSWYLYFPRYIKYWEIYNGFYLISLFRNQTENIIYSTLNRISLNLYWKLNFKRFFDPTFLENVLKKQYINTKPEFFGDIMINSFDAKFSEKTKSSLYVAVPSFKVTEDHLKVSLKPDYKIYLQTFVQFSKLLNEISQKKVDFLTFPELSIPHQFLGALVNFSKDFQTTVSAGLEYIIINNTVYNISVTIIPSQNSKFKFANIFFRIKNHYSPEEIKTIEEIELLRPVLKKSIYYLFNWNSVTFTLFNCFELSNISHRSLFKGRIDLIFGILLNKDRFYYDSIAQSTVRDLHCFLLNVNSSKYKGTFLLQPTSSDLMYLAELKGGIDPYFLLETVKVNELRNFQIKYLSGYRDEKPKYKPLPPDFTMDEKRK
ncbi:RNA-directed DNA polymerase [Leptospira bouyouniensis]|uniref:RNA-directed DNA polymerase n=1 Tax=Leptospira bouyouniensis TaxID=2484911 RepID=A0A7I0HWD1_9LEPT|nr:RNA-directed DNA polymerase [Leptospira bouyouniensis]TGL09119.1 RNA-directed DNA polymerase [Leptospira bouyouniensis]